MKKLWMVMGLMVAGMSAQAQQVVVECALSPAGSFQLVSKDVKGFAQVQGDTVTAKNVVVGLKNSTTKLALRDKHAKDKYLEVNKHPEVVLVSAVGKGGKGQGVIRIKGKEGKVSGTYQIKGKVLEAKFPVKISEYGISGVKYMGVGVDDEVIVNAAIPIR